MRLEENMLEEIWEERGGRKWRGTVNGHISLYTCVKG